MKSLQALPSIDRSILLMQLLTVVLVICTISLPDKAIDVWWFNGLVRGLFVFLVFAWVCRDAESRNAPLSSLHTAIVIMFPELFIPYYIFKTRGLKRGSLTLWKIIVFVFLAAVIGAIVQYLIQSLA